MFDSAHRMKNFYLLRVFVSCRLWKCLSVVYSLLMEMLLGRKGYDRLVLLLQTHFLIYARNTAAGLIGKTSK